MKILLLLLISTSLRAETLSGKYELQSSQINYLVKYLIKKADGASTQAKGKGECGSESCEFLVAAPAKSFTSKDGNRDVNMLTTIKADKYPLVVAKIKSSNQITNNELKAEVEVDMAGVKKNYPVIFKTASKENGIHAEGNFNLNLDDHQIEKPSLLGVHIENMVPITISADWKKAN